MVSKNYKFDEDGAQLRKGVCVAECGSWGGKTSKGIGEMEIPPTKDKNEGGDASPRTPSNKKEDPKRKGSVTLSSYVVQSARLRSGCFEEEFLLTADGRATPRGVRSSRGKKRRTKTTSKAPRLGHTPWQWAEEGSGKTKNCPVERKGGARKVWTYPSFVD